MLKNVKLLYFFIIVSFFKIFRQKYRKILSFLIVKYPCYRYLFLVFLHSKMKVIFFKYQGTGNDFIMLDNVKGHYDELSVENISFLCNRKMGIGADGLIKLSAKKGYDFEVEYFNADGSQSFCGNGARCSVLFAEKLGLVKGGECSFLAIDGAHKAYINSGIVRLEMLPVTNLEKLNNDFIIDTGSPHFVRFEEKETENIIEFGKEIRYSERFKEEGINVNVVHLIKDNTITVQTYERGVEDETLSCGTGVTACALVFRMKRPEIHRVDVQTKGGVLSVESDDYVEGIGFKNIWLSGPAKKVFDGSIEI